MQASRQMYPQFAGSLPPQMQPGMDMGPVPPQMPMQPPPRQDKADPAQNMPASESAHPERKESRDATANFANPNAAMSDLIASFNSLPSKSQMRG